MAFSREGPYTLCTQLAQVAAYVSMQEIIGALS